MSRFTKFLLAVLGILTIASGVYCMLDPAATFTDTMGVIVGITILVDGIAAMFSWYEIRGYEGSIWLLIGGIISAVLGFFVLNNSYLQVGIETFILYYIAAWFLLAGLTVVIYALKLRGLYRTARGVFEDRIGEVREGASVIVDGAELVDPRVDMALDAAREAAR